MPMVCLLVHYRRRYELCLCVCESLLLWNKLSRGRIYWSINCVLFDNSIFFGDSMALPFYLLLLLLFDNNIDIMLLNLPPDTTIWSCKHDIQ